MESRQKPKQGLKRSVTFPTKDISNVNKDEDEDPAEYRGIPTVQSATPVS